MNLEPIHCYSKLCAWWSRRSILFTTSSSYGITYVVKSRFSGCSLLLLCRPDILKKMFLDAGQSCYQIKGISCGLFSLSSCSEWELFMCKTNLIQILECIILKKKMLYYPPVTNYAPQSVFQNGASWTTWEIVVYWAFTYPININRTSWE